MPEPFTDHLRVLASRQQERGATVAQVVEAEVFGQLGAFDGRAKVPTFQVAGQQRPSLGRGENEVVLEVSRAGLQPFGRLPPPLARQISTRCTLTVPRSWSISFH